MADHQWMVDDFLYDADALLQFVQMFQQQVAAAD